MPPLAQLRAARRDIVRALRAIAYFRRYAGAEGWDGQIDAAPHLLGAARAIEECRQNYQDWRDVQQNATNSSGDNNAE